MLYVSLAYAFYFVKYCTEVITEQGVSYFNMAQDLSNWTKVQLGRYQVDFDEADTDKSGSLQVSEVFNVLKKSGWLGSEEDAKRVFTELDKNKDEKISRQEFNRAMARVPKITMQEMALRRAFKGMDKDNSGFLTKDEITNASTDKSGLHVPAKKIADLLIYVCKKDADKMVNYEEFLRVFGIQAAALVMRRAFEILDKDKSTFLTRDEIMDGVKAENELNLQADKIAAILITFCRDGRTKVNYEEFVQLYERS